ncbi:MAG: phosphonate C-P lyase system protein PhnH [Alphaproteobacteria bacterium]|nr:phosphonate C-P lyase system protein PhnH [Alphaproteobacteria bacterium]
MTPAPPPLEAVPIPAGFDDPTLDSQSVFRAVLEAFSRPGRVAFAALPSPPPGPLVSASAAVALTLFDLSTPVFIAPGIATAPVQEFLTFHTGCPLTEQADEAAFAIIDGADAGDLSRFAIGTPEYPDRSATVVIQVQALSADGSIRLRGPGVEHAHKLGVDGLHADFWLARERLGLLFPLGVDVILCAGSSLACLPRTTRAEV